MDKRWSAVFLLTLVFFVFGTLESASAQKLKNKPRGKPKDKLDNAKWIVKAGACPKIKWGAGLCAEFCSSDSDCEGNQKCCYNGCGHQCTEPYKVKRGRCPLPQGTHMCAEFCHHDGECPGDQKCCRTSCGHACTDIQPC